MENYECYNLIEKKCFKTNFSITTITYNQNIDEIIIGDKKGVCAFFNSKNEMIFSRKINKDTLMKVLTFSNLLMTASKEKIVTVWKIANVPLSKDDEILKNSSAYGQLMINNSIKDLDEQFKNLLAEPIMKNLQILKDDNKSDNEDSDDEFENPEKNKSNNKSVNSDNNEDENNYIQTNNNEDKLKNEDKEKFSFYNIFDDETNQTNQPNQINAPQTNVFSTNFDEENKIYKN